jgi:hypothetical protein
MIAEPRRPGVMCISVIRMIVIVVLDLWLVLTFEGAWRKGVHAPFHSEKVENNEMKKRV